MAGSLGLLPSGPDPVGERHVRSQLPHWLYGGDWGGRQVADYPPRPSFASEVLTPSVHRKGPGKRALLPMRLRLGLISVVSPTSMSVSEWPYYIRPSPCLPISHSPAPRDRRIDEALGTGLQYSLYCSVTGVGQSSHCAKRCKNGGTPYGFRIANVIFCCRSFVAAANSRYNDNNCRETLGTAQTTLLWLVRTGRKFTARCILHTCICTFNPP